MTRLHRWIGLWWLLGTVGGCFHHQGDIALLEGELRWMEDQLYALEDELAIKCRQLSECRDGQGDCCFPEVIYEGPVATSPQMDTDSNDASRDYEVVPSETDALSVPDRVPTLAEPPGYDVLDDDADERDATPDGRRSTPSGPTSPYEITTPPDLLTPPDELPEPEPPQISPPPPDTARRRPADDDASIQLIQHVEPASEPETEAEHTSAASTDVYVTHVLARAWLAHDRGFDGQPKEVDLLAVVEPRNVDGEPVLSGAPLSVVVLDASQPKETARVGRWDYSAAETRRLLQTTAAGQGIHLELQWPEEEPAAVDRLQLFVRYVTPEDRQLEHDVSVAVNRPTESPIARTGWRSNTRRPPQHKTEIDPSSPRTRVTSGIKLRPIPKDGKTLSLEPSQGENVEAFGDVPVILKDERPPQWSPLRP